jgi:hypothetical protein
MDDSIRRTVIRNRRRHPSRTPLGGIVEYPRYRAIFLRLSNLDPQLARSRRRMWNQIMASSGANNLDAARRWDSRRRLLRAGIPKNKSRTSSGTGQTEDGPIFFVQDHATLRIACMSLKARGPGRYACISR